MHPGIDHSHHSCTRGRAGHRNGKSLTQTQRSMYVALSYYFLVVEGSENGPKYRITNFGPPPVLAIKEEVSRNFYACFARMIFAENFPPERGIHKIIKETI